MSDEYAEYQAALDNFCSSLQKSPLEFRLRSSGRFLTVEWSASRRKVLSSVPGQIIYSKSGFDSELFRYVIEETSDIEKTRRGYRVVQLACRSDIFCFLPSSCGKSVKLVYRPRLYIVPKKEFQKTNITLKCFS